ncbi:substrate-binding periplasmic protein [Hydrogenophaga sp. PBL-H3]|uniref:substrate-binding periplasmic protein n=1 Tax=Hydrogenophaga sp. PBL-H3 TaxID=434010 RepID=UPI0013595F41|nr:transporter substrate-binding domain-containing protein [Hydrogenophaga sp. PBL-H3]
MTEKRTHLDRRQVLAGLLPLLAGVPVLAQAQTELSDLAKIRASGVLKVAVYKDNAPFSDGPTNDVKGLDVSIATALARQLGLKLALLPFDAGENMNDDLRNMVWRGHYLGYGPADVMLQVPGDRYLMARNRQVLILAPYMRQSLVLAYDTRRIADVSSPEDLKGLQLAAERGAGATSALMGYSGGLLRAQVGIHNTGTQAVQAMLDGKAVAAYVTRAQAESVLSRAEAQPGQYRLTPLALSGIPDTGWPVGMAIKAENKELGLALESALQSIRGSGELLAIFKQHGMTLTAP